MIHLKLKESGAAHDSGLNLLKFKRKSSTKQNSFFFQLFTPEAYLRCEIYKEASLEIHMSVLRTANPNVSSNLKLILLKQHVCILVTYEITFTMTTK